LVARNPSMLLARALQLGEVEGLYRKTVMPFEGACCALRGPALTVTIKTGVSARPGSIRNRLVNSTPFRLGIS
jgi:hypothetical protein